MIRIDTVIGSGTTALACALFAARHCPVRLSAGPPRRRTRSVESVPAATLTLLLELGITPQEVGVHGFTRERVTAWTDPQPTVHAAPASAHLDAAALHDALCRRVAAHSAITWGPRVDPSAPRAGWVDATGRRAVSAQHHQRPPRTWTAALITVGNDGADRRLQLAAAADGYAYRLGSADWLTIGWVGPGRPPLTGTALRARIIDGRAEWLLDGVEMPSAAATYRRPASVALSGCSAAVLRVGDAALTRDALASQGLSIGLSDACLITDPAATTSAMAARQRHAVARHVRHLMGTLTSVRCRGAPCWAQYREWLASTAAVAYRA